MIGTEVSAVGVVFKLSAMECLKKKVSLVEISISLSNSLKAQIDYKAFRFFFAVRIFYSSNKNIKSECFSLFHRAFIICV